MPNAQGFPPDPKWLAPLRPLPKMTNQKKTDYIFISKESERPAPDTLDETLPINNKKYDIKRPIDESYEKMCKQRIVFQESLPKWNYLIKPT